MKNKNLAAILAFFGGVFGIHRFYLGQTGLGILYILLSMTTLSVILGILDGIIFLTMDQEVFDSKYNKSGEWQDRRFRGRRQTRPDFRRQQRDPRRQSRPQMRDTRRRPAQSRPQPPRARPQSRPAARPQARRQHSVRRSVQGTPKKNPFKASGIRKFKDYDFESAIDDFQQALKIAPRDVAIHFNIACAYSQIENAEKAMYHIGEAVALGFNDFDKIDSHDSLAYIRIQPTWDAFKAGGYTNQKQLAAPEKNLLDDDILLAQIRKLQELKEKGLITEREFLEQKQKLSR